MEDARIVWKNYITIPWIICKNISTHYTHCLLIKKWDSLPTELCAAWLRKLEQMLLLELKESASNTRVVLNKVLMSPACS